MKDSREVLAPEVAPFTTWEEEHERILCLLRSRIVRMPVDTIEDQMWRRLYFQLAAEMAGD